MTTLAFTPSDVTNDWHRFSGSFITITMQSGTRLRQGVLELRGVREDGGEYEERIPHDDWEGINVEFHYATNGRMEVGEHTMRSGDVLEFCPKWSVSGYTYVPMDHGTRRAAGGRAASVQRCVWVSLAPNRQYRYGLSPRAFVTRSCGNFYSLGNAGSIVTKDLLALASTGPEYHTGPITPTVHGIPLTASLGVHYVTEGIGALCYNARHIIGWHIDGGFLIEERHRRLTNTLENTRYAPTEDLSGLWTSRILPLVHGIGNVSPRTSPTLDPDGSLELPPAGRPATSPGGAGHDWTSFTAELARNYDTSTTTSGTSAAPGTSFYDAMVRSRD